MNKKTNYPLGVTILLLTGLFLAGCIPGSPPANDSRTTTPEEVTPEQNDVLTPALTAVITLEPATDINEEAMTNSPPVSTPFPGAEQFIELARQDLAQRLGVDAAEIFVDSIEAMIWPDSSMGCPKPGLVYTQVQRDGYRILLRVGKEVFAYHGGGVGEPFLCENPGDSELMPPPGSGNE